jgi:cation:H+ antiporter
LSILAIWVQFAVAVLLIAITGSRLSRYGDVIAEKTGLSGTWIGVIMLATVTSLPELATGMSAVTVADAPNLAVGDVLGSCVFNLAILTVIDFLYRHESVYTRASQGHILSAGFGVMLIGFAGFNLLLESRGRMPAVGHVGVSSPIIVLLYIVAVRSVFHYEKQHRQEAVEETLERYPELGLAQAVRRYLAAAAVVVGLGIWLPFLGSSMAEVMGWQQTFVGTLFVALATSIPEVVVSIAAVRIGALNLAIGNLLGSNLFNILILALDDVAYLPAPLLSHVSPLHVVSSLSAVMMTGVATVGLIYRPRTRFLKTVGYVSLIIFLIYLLNSYVLFLYEE